VPWATISKRPDDLRVTPNLRDYERARREFSWAGARDALDGLPGKRGLNIAHEAVDRHAAGPRAAKTALRWIGRDGHTLDLSYRDLSRLSARFAHVLESLGVSRGDVVAVFAGRVPDLYGAALGALKCGALFCPLFSAFGPEPLESRLRIGRIRVLVTTAALYERRVRDVRGRLPDLEHVLAICPPGTPAPPRAHHLGNLLERADDRYEIPATSEDDPALLHFTSGTTGKPKGAVHVHRAVVAHHETGRAALDLHDDDIFWCTADPGWVTGTSYGIIAPLTLGVTSIVDEADFDASRWYRILARERVTVWYTAPTAIRRLMRAGADLARGHDLSALRFLASVGEPLNPEGVMWGVEAFGRPFHDNWWQTETGGIMVANFAATDIRPGSMGRPLPGVDIAIVERTPEGGVRAIDEPGRDGELAIREGWPSMFTGYLGDEERYRRAFAGGYYLSGDLVRRDEDGYCWFIGRADDVIKSAGHLIGPFEVESVLMEHPAVAEAGVIGKPDPVSFESVKAFVALRPGVAWTDALALELVGFARTRLGAAVAPKEIAWVPSLPKTRSGKIMRRLLKARELGLPEGDLSTLEPELAAQAGGPS
jgi:acetyl-CoA synthetase